MTVSQIIHALGGAAVLAAGLDFPGSDVGAKRIRAWCQRGSIPAEYWRALVAYARRGGVDVSLEDLALAHARQGNGE